MNIEYYIINPTGNITALVTSDVQKQLYRKVAVEIFKDNPNVEQVGFVQFKDGSIDLNMSGDEFCGNAAVSAAALFCEVFYKNGKTELTVNFTPQAEQVSVTVLKENGYYNCKGIFKTPDDIRQYTFSFKDREYNFPLVTLNGIMHIVADESLSESDARGVIKGLAKKLSARALGIMIFSAKTKTMKPLVYVSEVDTLFLENSCASGCCAVSSLQKDNSKIGIIQPSGTIYAEKCGGIIRLFSKIGIVKHCFKEIDYAEKNCF